MAYEYIVEVAGLLQTDPWVNVPHLATDAFIASFADWWVTNLPAGRKLYVELSNEVRLSQHAYAAQPPLNTMPKSTHSGEFSDWKRHGSSADSVTHASRPSAVSHSEPARKGL